MKQQIELLKKVKTIKPSEILKEAHVEGIKKCRFAFHIGDVSYCARGILMKKFGESKGIEANGINTGLENELFSTNLYNKKPEELTLAEWNKIFTIEANLAKFNDSSEDITFLDCAKELEKIGL